MPFVVAFVQLPKESHGYIHTSDAEIAAIIAGFRHSQVTKLRNNGSGVCWKSGGRYPDVPRQTSRKRIAGAPGKLQAPELQENHILYRAILSAH